MTEDTKNSLFKKRLPNVADLVDRIIKADLDHTVAQEVESNVDNLVPWAPNCIEFCRSKQFLGMAPFAKQAELMLHLFEEYCGRCSDLAYLADIPTADTIPDILTKIRLLEFGKCPVCGFTKADGRKSGVFKDPQEVIAIVGQRSGKSAFVAMAMSYLIHTILRLKQPWKAYGLTPGQPLSFVMVATTMSQSEDTLWGTWRGIFLQSAWFKTYKKVVDAEGKKHGVAETVRVNETFVEFAHKFLEVSFSSNNPDSLRGSTRIGGAIDELAFFSTRSTSTSKRANGEQTYVSINNSCATIRVAHGDAVELDPATTLPTALMFMVSSPQMQGDPMVQLYKRKSKSPRSIRRQIETWRFSPKMTMKALKEAGFYDDPNFTRDYGAVPPLTSEGLISNTASVTEAFNTPLAIDLKWGPLVTPVIQVANIDLNLPAGDRKIPYVSGEIVAVAEKSTDVLATLDSTQLGVYKKIFDSLMKKPSRNRPRVFSVDLGYSTNSLALASGYLVEGKFVCDFLAEIKPTPGRPVHISKVYDDVIVPLIEQLNVVAVYYDGWNSLAQLQDLAVKYNSKGPLDHGQTRKSWLRELREKGELPPLLTEKYSLTTPDALALVSRLEQGDFLFPKMEIPMLDLVLDPTRVTTEVPFANLALQLSTVRLRGTKLMKPADGNDDLFRAWANCAVKATSDELCMDLLKQDVRAQKKQVKAVAGGASAFIMAKSGRGNTMATGVATHTSGSDVMWAKAGSRR